MESDAAYTGADRGGEPAGRGVRRAMKVCQACGDTYRDHVDFCFNDGEILAIADAELAAAAAAAPPESELDAPLPRMVQGGQAAGDATAADTLPIPRSLPADEPEGVPAANAPADGDPETVALDAPKVPGDADAEDLDVEVTAVGGEQGGEEFETTEVVSAYSGEDEEATAATAPTGGARVSAPRITARPEPLRGASTDTVPPALMSSAGMDEPREPMRVAPLSEAETAPFARPQRRPSETDTPISSPRVAPRAPHTQPLHIPPPPKRRVGATPSPAEGQDRSSLLWFGAILVGVLIAVPFLAGASLIWFVVVGIGPGSGDGTDAVAIAPTEIDSRPNGLRPPSAPLNPIELEPNDDGIADADDVVFEDENHVDAVIEPQPEPQAPKPSGEARPVPAPSPVAPAPAPDRPADVAITFRIPGSAKVSLGGEEMALDQGGRVVLPSGFYTFTVSAPGLCPSPARVSWPADAQNGVLTPALAPCFEAPAPAPAPSQPDAPMVKVLVGWTGDRAFTQASLAGDQKPLPAKFEVTAGRHTVVLSDDLGDSQEFVVTVPKKEGERLPSGLILQYLK
jgi:hypothetical protein